jgi:hypothetical protein
VSSTAITQIIQTVAALLVLVVPGILAMAKYFRSRRGWPATSFWDDSEFAEKTRYFVRQRCRFHDSTADKLVERDLFSTLDRMLRDRDPSRVIVISAGSGVGKTSALLKYWVEKHRALWRSRPRILVVRLDDYEDAVRAIQEETQKAKTILFLDGLDEDLRAGPDLSARLLDLTWKARAYRNTVFTCRDHAMPTLPSRLRKEGQSWRMEQIALLEFRPEDVRTYLRKRFLPRGQIVDYFSAKRLVVALPEITQRPLILCDIEALIRSQDRDPYLFKAYENIVKYRLDYDGKKAKLDPSDLQRCCEELALDLNIRRQSRVGSDDLGRLTEGLGLGLGYWPVATRTLLTCERNQSIYRFEHQSYFDFFVASRLMRDQTKFGEIHMNVAIKRFLCEALARQWQTNTALALDPEMLDLRGVGQIFTRPVIELRATMSRVSVDARPEFYDRLLNDEARTCLHLFEPRPAELRLSGVPAQPALGPGGGVGLSVLFDHATHLVWQQSGSDSEVNRPGALYYVEYLNRHHFADLTAWRLPTVEEAGSLLQRPSSPESLHLSSQFDSRQWRIWCLDATENDQKFHVNFQSGSLTLAVEGPGAISFVRAVCSINSAI